MQERKWLYLLNILILIGLFCVFSFSNRHARSKLLTKNAKVPAAQIPENEASQVMVLATVHLRTYGDSFNHDSLEELLNVLERYKPDLIGIESLAPIVIRDLVNSGEANAEILEEFGKRTAEFGVKTRSALQANWTKANARINDLLENIEAGEIDREQNHVRKELVLNFLAANDLYSALLQWSYLSEEMRTDIDRLDKEILDYFKKHVHSANENVSIGIALATRLNHQMIYAINDHRDKEDFVKVADALSKELENNEYMKSQPWKALYKELIGIQDKAYKSGNLLPLYVYLNSEEYVQRDIESQWQILFKAKLPSGLAQTRIAYWDVRNLGIAANCRRAIARHPGKKMLVIIGATHKIFLDAIFAESMDIKVVQLEEYLHKPNLPHINSFESR